MCTRQQGARCATIRICSTKENSLMSSQNKPTEEKIKEYLSYEKALVDGDFFGTYRLCLNCIDKFMKEEDEDEG